ncbi:hypothetical protein [Paenibacillus prosopidis]|uniref:ATP-grasp domain-containing protein n=1 Tax=Paenibacillus prosopidis TaxID=630520 RepID=A0A368VVM6_9BACL|nr:hypothetical protein [Paenibacillus prosopidis]RCW43483.1 hypothetical protein DFP97_113156 [Paenibacillus prosopidis]
MTVSVHCGTFEAERYWRDLDLAVLPSLTDRSNKPIVDAMDEMLFAFCMHGDSLLTRGGMDKSHYDYLQSLGFRFKTNLHPLNPIFSPLSDPNIFQLLNDSGTSTPDELQTLLPEGARIEPFAVLPGAIETIQRYRLSSTLPHEDDVCRVNSKIYSVMMRERLGIPNIGEVIEHPDQLLSKGMRLLERGSLLIKDDYGVSGKGNMQIDSERTLQRLVSYLSSQVDRGKRMQFVLEPLVDRGSDFSCQFRLNVNGSFNLISLQQLRNVGYAYDGSYSADPSLFELLVSTGYFELMERIGALLNKDGYYGDVCVDSMLLRDGKIEPLVEINARKSMSLIKHYMDRYFEREDLKGCLTQVNVISSQPGNFSDVLERLEDTGILFAQSKGSGIIPLTSGTLFPRTNVNASGVYKGRLYAAIGYRTEEDLQNLSEGMKEVLIEYGLKLVV